MEPATAALAAGCALGALAAAIWAWVAAIARRARLAASGIGRRETTLPLISRVGTRRLAD